MPVVRHDLVPCFKGRKPDGHLRVTDIASGVTDRSIMAKLAAVRVDLLKQTYSVEGMSGGTLNSDRWVSPDPPHRSDNHRP